MIPIPPEQTQALRAVLAASSPKVASALRIDQSSVDQFIDGAVALVAGTTHIRPNQRYCLALSNTSGTGAPLTPLVLRQYLQSGKPFVRLDSNFRIVEALPLPVLLPDATERTIAEQSFEIVVHDKQLYHMLMGRLINEMEAGTSSTANLLMGRLINEMEAGTSSTANLLMGRLINEIEAGTSSTANPEARWRRPFADIEGL